jgi:signal transduction histidine kinase
MGESGGGASPEHERDYYKRQADQLAGENLKLDYTIAGLRHDLRQKRQGFALLSELQQSIGAHKQISSIFEITMAAINTHLGMDKTVVLTPTQHEHRYRPSQWLGFHEDAAAGFAGAALDVPPEVATAGGLLLISASSPPADHTPLVRQISTTFALPYFICLPVLGDDGPIALLLSGRLKEAKPFYSPLDRGDVDTLQAIAGLISASVRNMRVAVLEEMDRLKTDFFANLSHEFRTPITLTLGPLEQLLAGRYGAVPAPARDQLRVMARNQERLLGMVNQILDLAKLEAGGMQLKAAPLPDVNAFVEERVRQFRGLVEERGIMLQLTLDRRLRGADLYVDREKLDRLLVNLLSNAVKFTRRGSIEVATELVDRALQLSVADTGIGIKEDQLPHIFDRFRQADGSVAREYAGTGIGLALAKEAARLHGGDITVRSEFGTGSTFRVSIPLGTAHLSPAWVVDFVDDEEVAGAGLRRDPLIVQEGAADRSGVAEANREAEARRDPRKSTILYAEDNADLRHHVRDLLAGEYNVFLAASGRDGFEQARRLRPDLVLSDQMMPGMSGRDLLRAIREDADLRATPVIFLSARVGDGARIETLAAGADDYLAKPFHEAELRARVRNLLRARAQERELSELNHQLQTASRHKTEFLANMSHELRTPLNAIIGFTRIVQRRARDVLPTRQYDNLGKVLISAEHLLALINDILDLSKIEAGRVEPVPEPFVLRDLIDLCLQTVEPMASNARLRLVVRVEETLPVLFTDQERLKQILINLLSNAVKFTRAGTVTVCARPVPPLPGRPDLVDVEVTDTGIGIPKEKLRLVFEEFRQADSGTTRQYGGTGLGLSISRRLARLLGGDLTVTSAVGEGSTFRVTVPVRYAPPAADDRSGPGPERGGAPSGGRGPGSDATDRERAAEPPHPYARSLRATAAPRP